MSDTTTHLLLPFILAAQAQKHVTHNEALRLLDAVVQLAVIDRTRTAPPASPADGARHIVGSGATGAWAGWDLNVAVWTDGAWLRLPPRRGWLAWIEAEGQLLVWTGSAWAPATFTAARLSSGEIQALGIATGADATNRLAVASPAALFTHAGAGHRLVINKAAAADTGSIVFQTGWSGRAEMGLAGEDDFSFRVSPDGAAWHDAIRIARATGRARVTGLRETLGAPRSYFVRTDGSDSNSGLANNAAGAFRTIGRALEIAFGTLDLSRFDVTILIAPGIYEEWLEILAPSVGAGVVTLRGTGASPGDVIIRGTTASAPPHPPFGVVRVWNGAAITLDNLRVERASGPGAACFDIRFGATVAVGFGQTLHVGASTGACFRMVGGTLMAEGGTLAMVSDAPGFIQVRQAGTASIVNATVSLDGRTFATAGFQADRCGVIAGHTGLTLTGTATGDRVQIRSNGVIDFGARALSTLPGTANGIIDTGGVYIPVP